MLQGLNLPFVDLSAPENGLHAMFTGPVADAATGASFADVFRLAPERLAGSMPVTGMPLPAPGNELPDGAELVAAEAPQEDEILNVFWSAALPLDPTAAAPRLSTSPAIESIMQSTRLASASPAIDLSGSPAGNLSAAAAGRLPQLTMPGAEPGGRLLPALPAPAAGPAVDMTPAAPKSLSPALPTQPALPPQTPAAPSVPAASAAPPALTASLLNAAVPERALRQTANDAAGRQSLAARLAAALPGPADDASPQLKPAPALLPTRPAAPTAQMLAAVSTDKATDEVSLLQQVQLQGVQAGPVATRGSVDIPAATVPALPGIATPVQDAAWGDRLGERLLMMADSKTQVAEIRLTPAELGPLKVRISIEDGTTSVTFHAQHAVTREALEQALPRLRELFASNGLTLGDSHVAGSGEQGVPQGKPEQRDAAPRAAEAGSDVDRELTADAASPERGSRQRRPEQLLDTFA